MNTYPNSLSRLFRFFRVLLVLALLLWLSSPFDSWVKAHTEPNAAAKLEIATTSATAVSSILFQFNGATIDDRFGYSVAGGQDINGDNHPDFVVGAIQTDPNGLTNAGSAFAYSGLDGALLRRFDGASADMWFGLEVAEVGDVNNDGKADILVGTPKAAPGGVTWAGSAYVYSGASGALLFQFDGSATYGYMGEAAAGAGDINHDNHADIIVSARGAGKVFVFSGSDGTTLHQFSGPFNFGSSVANVGDVNADGVPDIGVGSPLSTPGGLSEAGSAFIYSGATGALLHQFDGANAGDWVGISIAGAGDLNNDGRSDLIVAAMCNLSNHTGCTPSGARGYVSVFSGETGSLLFHFEGEAANDAFGRSVAGPGDMNGDGVPDIVVGAFHADTGSTLDTGRVYIYSGADGTELYRLSGYGWYDYLGNSVSGAGDVNGDGNADAIVAAFYADPLGRNGAGSVYVLSLSSFAAPTPAFPNNFSPPQTSRPLFDWSNVAGAFSYNLQISTNQNFTSLVLNQNVTPSAYIVTTDLPKGTTLFWRVRANGSNGPSAWSRVRHFDTPNPPSVPALLSPALNAMVANGQPALDWSDSSPGVDHYEVQLSTDPYFTSTLGRGQGGRTAVSQYTVETALGTGAYYWQVRAVNTSGQFSNWSSSRSFRVP